MTSLSELYGIDISEIGVVRLNKQSFASVDLDLYPPHREHFLIHAIQFQSKLPSEKSMLRSERRNQRKSGAQLANDKTGRPSRTIINPRRSRPSFVVPAKYFPKVDSGLKKRSRGRRIRVAFVPLVGNKKTRTAHRPKRTAFKIRSPSSIVLKSERNAAKQQLQKLRKQAPGPVITKEVDATPLYFKKKKANQKRRRQIKHQLIKKNRKALYQIYGEAIFQRGWPISIKEIKEALGIKEPDHLAESVQGLADLVKETQA